ncbi:hypothetical protein HMPREF1583_00153 [Gardnerella vaginalis JCP8151B]|nr:hypothetical protein HMPREF1583_00153 [Gardnerella vaginalis JCP8151B]EPI48515.1 hypothetical protein HMPREF1582_00165 [Gardnerella vaginalis JCP8151A]
MKIFAIYGNFLHLHKAANPQSSQSLQIRGRLATISESMLR